MGNNPVDRAEIAGDVRFVLSVCGRGHKVSSTQNLTSSQPPVPRAKGIKFGTKRGHEREEFFELEGDGALLNKAAHFRIEVMRSRRDLRRSLYLLFLLDLMTDLPFLLLLHSDIMHRRDPERA
jgi:hypothetical protein